MIDRNLRARLFRGSVIGTLTSYPSGRRQIALDWLNESNRSATELVEFEVGGVVLKTPQHLTNFSQPTIRGN